jgi:hypothetical protein
MQVLGDRRVMPIPAVEQVVRCSPFIVIRDTRPIKEPAHLGYVAT